MQLDEPEESEYWPEGHDVQTDAPWKKVKRIKRIKLKSYEH